MSKKPQTPGGVARSASHKAAPSGPAPTKAESVQFLWETISEEEYKGTRFLSKEDEDDMAFLDKFAKTHPVLKTKVSLEAKFDVFEKLVFYYKYHLDKNTEQLNKIKEDVASVILSHAKLYSRETTPSLKKAAGLEEKIQADTYMVREKLHRSLREWRNRLTVLLTRESSEPLIKDPNCTKLLSWEKDSVVIAQNTAWDPKQLVPRTDIVDESAVVGEGAFGIVRKAMVYGNLVAMKVIKQDPINPQNEEVSLKTGKSIVKMDKASLSESTAFNQNLAIFKQECELLAQLDHENIIKFMGACYEVEENGDSFCCLLTEFADNGSLADVLYKSNVQLSFNRKLIIIQEIVKGMNYLHNREQPVLHLDMKPGNILLDGNYHARISDFGMSKIVSEQLKSSTLGFVGGTPYYMAPEVLPTGAVSKHPVSIKSDVYSFGIMVNELILEEKPYSQNIALSKDKEKPFQTLIQLVTSGETPGTNRPKVVEDNDPLKSFILSCITASPKHRPSFPEISEQKFWDKALKIYYDPDNNPPASKVSGSFGGQSKIPFKDWMKTLSNAFDVISILSNENDPHYRAITNLNRIGNVNDFITIDQSARFISWVSGIAPKGNELTNTIFKIIKEPWFFGILSREDATARLSNKVNFESETYLVRWDEVEKKWILSFLIKKENSLDVKHEDLGVISLKELLPLLQQRKKKKPTITRTAVPHVFEALAISDKDEYLSSDGNYHASGSKKDTYHNRSYVYLM